MKYLSDTLAFVSKANVLPPAFQPLTDFSLIIIVGLTGVGKSTVVDLLQNEFDFSLLPNRRKTADAIIIASVQAAAGEPPHPVTDRLKRFEYTARYRARHPGGMAHALSQLAVKSIGAPSLFIFDGLRGLDEVKYAAGYFPKAKFVVLDAPDLARLQRLLKRADTFDTTSIDPAKAEDNLVESLSKIANIGAAFSKENVAQIAQMARAGGWPANEVLKKVSIIVKERHNYDFQAARAHLTERLPPEQVLVVDTAKHSPDAVAELVKRWPAGSKSQVAGKWEGENPAQNNLPYL